MKLWVVVNVTCRCMAWPFSSHSPYPINTFFFPPTMSKNKYSIIHFLHSLDYIFHKCQLFRLGTLTLIFTKIFFKFFLLALNFFSFLLLSISIHFKLMFLVYLKRFSFLWLGYVVWYVCTCMCVIYNMW